MTTRRNLIIGAATALAAPSVRAASSARVVIIGGGFGGASLARALRRHDPALSITLIEREAQFVTCPFSNGVLGGMYPISRLTFAYDRLKAASIDVVHDTASGIDPAARIVSVAGGQKFPYDYLAVSPGIQFDLGRHRGL